MPLPVLAAIGVGAGLKALGGALGGASRAKDAKRSARNEQKATQYKVNQKQKGLNRKALNVAALMRSLHREGWFGDQFMQDHGTYDPNDFKYDAVPLLESPGVWSSALGGAARGGVEGLSDWFLDSDAAGRQAGAAAGAGTRPPLPNVGGIDILPTRRVGR